MTKSSKIKKARQDIELLLSSIFRHIPQTCKSTWDALPHVSTVKAMATLCNSIVVLTDMVAAHTYIYHGRLGKKLGISDYDMRCVESLWPDTVAILINEADSYKLLLLQYEYFKTLLATQNDIRPDIQCECTIYIKGKDACNLPCVVHTYCLDTQMRYTLVTLTLAHKGQPLPGTKIYNSLEYDATEGVYTDNCAYYDLTKRENEIVALAKKGLSSKQIATRLHISESTVSHHRAKIVKKTGTHNFMEAVNSL